MKKLTKHKIHSVVTQSICTVVAVVLLAGCSYQKSDDQVRLFEDDRVITIVDSTIPPTLEPTVDMTVVHRRLFNTLEPLVKNDATLRKTSALAESWGSPDETTIEFHLREGVQFHDGTEMDADDVLYSFNRAKTYGQSGIKESLQGISMVKIDAHTVQAQLQHSDPTVLDKVALVYILPEGNEPDKEIVGTGAYKITKKDKSHIVLNRFDGYWGGLAAASQVELVAESKQSRIRGIKEYDIDILLDTPPEVAEVKGYETKRAPGMDPTFLMFNLANPNNPLREKELRTAIDFGLQKENFKKVTTNIQIAKQFISSAIFGYDPQAKTTQTNPQRARDLIKTSSYPNGFVAHIITPKANAPIAEVIQKDLREIGIQMKIEIAKPADLMASITSTSSESFVVGWQFTTGDGVGFLYDFFHSKGQFNFGGYQNAEVDVLLERSQTNTKPQSRLKDIRKVLELLAKDKVGIPLFETVHPYLIREDIEWEPRLDGLIDLTQISSK